MEIKLLSGALGAEIKGIDLTDVSNENFKKINDLLLEHKVIFFREQPITKDQQVALAEKFGPLETHAYVKGLENYPEIVRIIKGKEEKNQWGENWHSDVSYNAKPTKAVILRSLKIPPVGGDTCFSNMELAWETLDPKIQDKIKNKKAIHSSLEQSFLLIITSTWKVMKKETMTLILTNTQLLELIQKQAKKFFMLIGLTQNKLLVWIKKKVIRY